VIIAALISLKIIFVSAPLEIAPFADRGDYPEGTDIKGIKWEKGMSELRILISNHTAYSYDDLDISFTPNVPTREVVQVSKVAEVSLTLIEKIGDVDVNSGTVGAELYASGRGFRMLCSKLPKDTTVEVLAALVAPPLPSTGSSDSKKGRIVTLSGDRSRFAGPKRTPTTMYVKGQYTVMNRPHPIEITYGIGK
jgi:hypothetical protein